MKPPPIVRRSLSLCVCMALLFGGAPSLAAPPDDGTSEVGVKSFAVKKAVQAMAKVIRVWGPRIGEITERMDPKAVKWFAKHASKIAGELDRIAEMPDLIPRIVGEKIWYFLVGPLRVDGGSAKVIAVAIEAAIEVFL